ncbi:MAG: ABC transporter permease [Betaproteobacteria bacterium]|nr:MAG: ABC transporter permease [Betaproteobacteria bacterium]
MNSRRLANVLYLGVKELRSLRRDPLMLFFIVFSFSIAIYSAASVSMELNKAPVAVIDEDRSQLSAAITGALLPPHFKVSMLADMAAADAGMDRGRLTFVLDIPSGFQRDMLAGRQPAIQLNVDATQTSQAFLGASYIQSIVAGEVAHFLDTRSAVAAPEVKLALRMRFNPNLSSKWFSAVMELINNITMLAIILTGAAVIREREHGTIEHLLSMPLSPAQIMAAKVWANGLVVLAAAAVSLNLVVRGLLDVPVAGSVPLFLLGTLLHLFAVTSMGIFLGTVARSMPQLALLVMLVVLPLEVLSGGMTPRESMPEIVRQIMLLAPTTHFVSFAQAILYRGAGLDVVWPQFLAIVAIGGALFAAALARFRRTIADVQT